MEQAMTKRAPCILQLLVSLRPGGAERLALNILEQGKGRFRGLVAGLYYPPGELADMATALSLPSVALRAETLSRTAGIYELFKLLRREQVTLLHIQAAWLLPYALPAAWLARVPIVYTEHASHSLTIMPKLRLFTRFAAPFIRNIVCVSPQLADFFETIGIAGWRLTVISNGVNLTDFSPNGKAHAPPWPSALGEDPFVFGTVGRLTEAKDHAALLQAFALVSKLHARARLLLVGDGELRRETESLVRELGLADKVCLAGACTDIPARLRGMDAFVLSSKREGMPMAVLEAMACGLPVISTDVGDIASLNKVGPHIHLVPPQDIPALARAMERMLVDRPYRERIGATGRQYVLRHYGSRAMAEKYIRLYEANGGMQ